MLRPLKGGGVTNHRSTLLVIIQRSEAVSGLNRPFSLHRLSDIFVLLMAQALHMSHSLNSLKGYI